MAHVGSLVLPFILGFLDLHVLTLGVALIAPRGGGYFRAAGVAFVPVDPVRV